MLKKLCLLVLTLGLISTSAFAQRGQNFTITGNGARAVAMGNAFTALADDATAISWNPAGLSQLQKMEASVYGRYGLQTIDLENVDVESESQFQLNFVSFVLPLNMESMNLVAGIAFRRYFDLAQETTIKFSETDQIKEVSEGGINAISPSVGLRVNDVFSVGVTFNLLGGNQKYEYMDAVLGDEVMQDVDFTGFNIDIGVLAKLSPQFTLGAKVTLPYSLDYEFNEYVDNGVDLQPLNSETFTYEFPVTYSIGAAFRASDNLILTVDYQARPYEGAELTYDGDKIDEFSYNYNSFHLGAEYLLFIGDLIVPLRAGLYTFPQGVEDADEKQVMENVLTLGSGLLIGNLNINAAIEAGNQTYDIGSSSNTSEFSQNSFRFTFGATLHL
jgi:hypothetical protein